MSDAQSPPQRRIWLDGRLVHWESAQVHLLSHSLQRGSLVFDYMSVHETPRGAAVFRLPDHVARFLRSVELVGLPLAQGASEVRQAILEAVRANPGARAAKVCAYLASVEVDVVPLDEHVSLAVAAYDPLRDVIERHGAAPARRSSLRLRLERQRRNRRHDILAPQAKAAGNYTSPMAAKWAARRDGFDEVLLLDDEDCLAEGPTTNVFLVDREGTLRTPPAAKVLHGVTRLSILEIAKHDGLPALEAPIRIGDLESAAEVFLTGTSAGVWPVESIDGRAVGAGAPGPVSRHLRQRFQEITAGRDADFAHWLSPV